MNDTPEKQALLRLYYTAERIHQSLSILLPALSQVLHDEQSLHWLLSNGDYLYVEGTALPGNMATLYQQMGRVRAFAETHHEVKP